jgi:hypothetical protein
MSTKRRKIEVQKKKSATKRRKIESSEEEEEEEEESKEESKDREVTNHGATCRSCMRAKGRCHRH